MSTSPKLTLSGLTNGANGAKRNPEKHMSIFLPADSIPSRDRVLVGSNTFANANFA